jgi:NTP pyrophosphatase (non-canonical NTP hydrolase)
MTVTYSTLREAIDARMEEWDGQANAELPLTYFSNEMAGECGEACNIVKKLEREAYGMDGTRATKDDLASELADVIITTYRLAAKLGINLDEATENKFNWTSVKMNMNTRYVRK